MLTTNGINILYMEDDDGTARLVQKRLQRIGYSVKRAGDGEEGLELYKSEEYDLVIVDQSMPVYDGIEVIKIITDNGVFPPIIMITGGGDEAVAVKAMKYGASDYIIKDVSGHYLELLPGVIEKTLQESNLEKERDEAIASLKKSEEKFRTLTENINIGIYRSTIETGEFVEVNPAMVKLLGYDSREELLKIPVEKLYSDPEYRSGFKMNMLENSSTRNHEICLKRKDGAEINCFESSVVVNDKDGNPLYFDGIIEDITERKQLEEAKNMTEKLETLNNMVVTLNHEMNQPLSIIISQADMAMQDAGKESQLYEDISLIKEEAWKITEMIKKIRKIKEIKLTEYSDGIDMIDLNQLDSEDSYKDVK